MKARFSRAASCGLLAGVIGMNGTPAAASGFEIAPLESGGMSIWVTSYNDSSHRYPVIQFFGSEPTANVRYSALKSDGGALEQIATGEVKKMRPDEWKQITGESIKLDGRSRFTVCVEFQNSASQKHHLLMGFFEEPESVHSGASFNGMAKEYAPPVRLLTDGDFSCEQAIEQRVFETIPVADRVTKLENPDLGPERLDDPSLSSLVHISSHYIEQLKEFGFNAEIFSRESLSDIEFSITVAH